MTLWLAVVIGWLYATGMYMVLRRSVAKLIIGLALLSHAANLLIFTVSNLQHGQPPVLSEHGPTRPLEAYVDPLPQALILTAIVISFGVMAFTLVLLHRVVQSVGTDDLDRLKATET